MIWLKMFFFRVWREIGTRNKEKRKKKKEKRKKKIVKRKNRFERKNVKTKYISFEVAI